MTKYSVRMLKQAETYFRMSLPLIDLVVEILTEGSGLSISGMELTINPTGNLVEGTQYYVIIPAGAIETTTGSPFTGVTLKDDWDFTTEILPPTVITYNPATTATEISRNPVLELTFNENIVLGNSGYFKIF